MIDKSIRQHYQDGENVDQLKKWTKKLTDPYIDEGGKIDASKIAGSAVRNLATRKLATQIGGTGILSSLGPIGMIIAMFLARKGIGKGQEYLTQKLGEGKGGALQAFQAGFGSPQEGRELRKLENRRANMLQRKDEGKNYSEKNLDIVTRAIAEAKGLDINNPNEMKNIDKPITQIQIEKSITEPPQIIPETPEIISPHLLGGDEIITPRVIPEIPEVISPHLEGDRTIPTPTSTLTTDFAFEDVKRAAQEKEEQDRIVAAQVQQAAAIKAENDRQQRERDAAAARAPISVPVPAHISGGGGNGGQSGSMPTGTGGRNPWGRAKGGRVDKALGGRVRDI